jgi:hypothetical protein
MTIFRLPLGAVLAVLVVGAWHHSANIHSADAEEKECETHGTSVFFVESTADAARYALEEEKLLFVLHVSGHFEESDFT